MAIFKQKILWLGVVIVFAAVTIFGLATMGSVAGSKPKELPVALVVLDQGAGDLNVGETIEAKLKEAGAQLPVQWKVVASEEEARQGIDNRDYYGALVLPADLSSGVLSLAGAEPVPATVRILVNEGMNTQASTVAKQVLEQAMRTVSAELTGQLLDRAGQQAGGSIPAAAAKALFMPFNVQEETLHPAGTNNASGNAPGLLTQIAWIGSLVTALILFLAGGKAIRAAGGRSKLQSLAAQAVAGIAVVGLASGFLVWMASSWYGMGLASATDTWLFLWLGAAAFFLLQSALLNWIGMPAMGILVLLMFFSMPLLNMAPEMLPDAARDWLYSWTPLRLVAGGLRGVMYFGGLDAEGTNAGALWSVAGAFLLLLLGVSAKKGKARSGANAAAGAEAA